MRGLWLEGQTLRLRDDLALPEPPAGEARVRVTLAGICNTDLELVRGYYPFTGIPGHEFVGRVEAAPGAPSWEGRRVVGEINASCGTCAACSAGRSPHCERRTVLGIRDRNGAFAEYLTLPLLNLHEVPAGLPDEAAVFTEPLAAALEIQEQVRIGPGDRVVVVGDGKLGNLVAQTLALTGCALKVAGRHSDLPAGEADVAIECTGNAEGLERARAAVRPRGTIVLKSTYRGRASLDASRIVVDEITLVGSRCGPFAPALALLAANRVAVAPLVHARFPLRDGVAAFEEAARPGVLKVLVQMA
jgi:threonine dehydrogenase-like Zn-dependent dehydrogenase